MGLADTPLAALLPSTAVSTAVISRRASLRGASAADLV